MRISEVTQHVDLSRRAIKYYEEQGLLTVNKDENGYRNYTEENLMVLKEISAYRKLGISISDIRKLLHTDDTALLKKIYEEKSTVHHTEAKELEALHSFIETHDIENLYETVDYQTIGKALKDMIPGFYGYYFMNHFQPYLQMQITTPEQQKAYENIIDFWDHADIKIPFFMKLVSYIMYKFAPRASMDQMISTMELQIQKYLHPTEEEYEILKEQTRKNVKQRNSFFFKYHPAFISQRKFMKRMQDQGYNDIFIPNMRILSPSYKEYHDALTKMNSRICADLGLYYDSNYHLVIKK